MTKLRLSNHSLLIETGRHCKIERQLRFCPFCPTMIEDETHFLVQCPTYKEMRDKLLTKHILANVEITDNHKFHDIWRQKELNMTAKFIFDAFEASLLGSRRYYRHHDIKSGRFKDSEHNGKEK